MTNKKMNDEDVKIELSRNTDGLFILTDDRRYHLAVLWGIATSNASGYESANRKDMDNSYVFTVRAILNETTDDDSNKYEHSFELPVSKYVGLDSFEPKLVDAVERCFSRTNFPYARVKKDILLRLSGFSEAINIRFRDIKHNIRNITQIFEQPAYMPKSIYGDPESQINRFTIILKPTVKK